MKSFGAASFRVPIYEWIAAHSLCVCSVHCANEYWQVFANICRPKVKWLYLRAPVCRIRSIWIEIFHTQRLERCLNTNCKRSSKLENCHEWKEKNQTSLKINYHLLSNGMLLTELLLVISNDHTVRAPYVFFWTNSSHNQYTWWMRTERERKHTHRRQLLSNLVDRLCSAYIVRFLLQKFDSIDL